MMKKEVKIMKKVKFTITYDSKILGILGSKTTEVHVGPLKNLENMKAGLNALGKDVSYDYVVIN
jgi:hypothetical protein|tara:strand:+ start:116 stop:307 length:192 start_codon:yes stop_codon:yes gene_type:complete